jgi:4-hydroxy-tetrahydrodipicolinate reductase
MKKINLGISGCMGRMGQQLIKSSKKNKSFNLKTLTENRYINRKIQGIKPEFNTEDAFKKTDLIIDFTIPKCTLEILKIASKLKKKVVIGTTGFNRSQESQIKKYSKNTINVLNTKPKTSHDSKKLEIDLEKLRNLQSI